MHGRCLMQVAIGKLNASMIKTLETDVGSFKQARTFRLIALMLLG